MRIKIPYITTSIEQDLLITLYLAPLWWVLGFSIFIYHAVALWVFVKLVGLSITKRKSVRVPNVAAFLLLLITIYSLSLLINYPQNESVRIIASLYSYSFWFMGVLLMLVVYNSFDTDSIQRLSKTLRLMVIVIGVLAIMVLFLWLFGQRVIRYPTLLLMLFPVIENFPLLREGAVITLLKTELFASMSLPRVWVMAHDGPALANLLILSLPLASTYYRNDEKGVRLWMFVSLGLLVFLATFARSSFLAFVIAGTVVYMMNKKSRIVLIMFSIAMFIFVLPFLSDLFEWIRNMRAGGSARRFYVYEYSVGFIMKNSPIIGMGVKPVTPELHVPVGSHSNYLSLFAKTGFMGLFAFIAFQIHILRTWIGMLKENKKTALKMVCNCIGISLLAAPLYLMTKELDAPQIVAFVYFLLVGVLTVIKKEVLVTIVKES